MSDKRNNWILLVLATICSMFFLEIIFRISGTYSSYNERSSRSKYISPFEVDSNYYYFTKPVNVKIKYSNIEFDTEWNSNNLGLKNKEINLYKNGRRILVFGDSFTEGVGAPNDSSYPRILENLLNFENKDKYEVVNCGLSGADIFSEYRLFADKMLEYNPDLVMLTFNTTDIYEYSIRGGFDRFKQNNIVEFRKPPWFEPLYAKSYLARFLIHSLFGYNYSFLRPDQVEESQKESLKEISCAIDSFQTLCTRENIDFRIIFHPLSFDWPECDVEEIKILIKYCEQHNISFTDVFRCMKNSGINKKNYKTLYWPKDGHFNSKGYELMARCVFEN